MNNCHSFASMIVNPSTSRACLSFKLPRRPGPLISTSHSLALSKTRSISHKRLDVFRMTVAGVHDYISIHTPNKAMSKNQQPSFMVSLTCIKQHSLRIQIFLLKGTSPLVHRRNHHLQQSCCNITDKHTIVYINDFVPSLGTLPRTRMLSKSVFKVSRELIQRLAGCVEYLPPRSSDGGGRSRRV